MRSALLALLFSVALLCAPRDAATAVIEQQIVDPASVKITSNFPAFTDKVWLLRGKNSAVTWEDVLFPGKNFLARVMYHDRHTTGQSEPPFSAVFDWFIKSYPTFSTAKLTLGNSGTVSSGFGDVPYRHALSVTPEWRLSCIVFFSPFDQRSKVIQGFFCAETRDLQNSDIQSFFSTLGVRGVVEPWEGIPGGSPKR